MGVIQGHLQAMSKARVIANCRAAFVVGSYLVGIVGGFMTAFAIIFVQ